MKQWIAFCLDLFFLNRLLYSLTNFFYGTHIRVVNYHGTSLRDMQNFEDQLKFYKKRYVNVDLNDLNAFFQSKKLQKGKRGLVISFDDGHRSNFVNALPLLMKYGYTGWFMIPSGVIDYASDEQRKYVGTCAMEDARQFPDGRFLMDWEEIKVLSEHHAIGCHTFSHHRMRLNDAPEALEREIVFAKRYMEERLGRSIEIFCWVGGEEWTYTKQAAFAIRHAGYRYSFMTNTCPVTPTTNPLQIQRTNIEAHNPLYLVRFQLSFLMDVFYFWKRRRVAALTK